MSSSPLSPLNQEIPDEIRDLQRMLMSYVAWSELSPREQADVLQWDGPPTSLATRHISGPEDDPESARDSALLLALYGTREIAEAAADARAIAGIPVHRLIVELEARSLLVIDARKVTSLTDLALLHKDPRAWKKLRIIRKHFGAHAVWIRHEETEEERKARASSAGDPGGRGPDVVVLFADAIDHTLFVAHEAIYSVARGEASFVRPVEEPQPHVREPHARRRVCTARHVFAHMAAALALALAVPTAVELASELLGVNVAVPAVVPALAGLAIGGMLARPVIRRIRAGRTLLVHVLELPATQALLNERLDDLQRGQAGDGLRRLYTPNRVRDNDLMGRRSSYADIGVDAERLGVVGDLRNANGRHAVLATTLMIAVPAALAAHVLVDMTSKFLGVSIVMPVVIPALVGLGVGAAAGVAITRRLRRYGNVIRCLRDLPDNHARQMNILDALERKNDDRR